MNPMIILICILVVSFVTFLIAYSGEKRQIQLDKKKKNSYTDDPSILFDEYSQDEDIEII